MKILGLHHVTATAGVAQADLDFYADLLGLRLVKKTVNFDNHHVYHFYYGTERGTPGTIWTTFPYHGHGVPAGSHGAGQIRTTSFSVPKGSLPYWRARLERGRVAVRDVPARFGDESIECADPSGLIVELVATDRDTRDPWTGGTVAADAAIRGLHGISMILRAPERTVELMTSVLNFRVVAEHDGHTRLAADWDEPGRFMEIIHDAGAPLGRNGLGTVHHVAMAIAGADEQLALREQLLRRGLHVTEVRDRQYFLSIYFREPGGVLFEVATLSPGFETDEPRADLGRSLKLPPWEELYRHEIEMGLPRIDR